MAPLPPRLCIAALATAIAGAANATALPALDGSTDSLRTAWAALQSSDDGSATSVERVASTQSSGELGGTLHAVVDMPFRRMLAALSDAAAWCAVLILDPNVHRCRPRGDRIDVEFGESNTAVAFTFQRAAGQDEYMQVRLTAPSGPLGTKDYAIAFEAAPLDAGRSLVHLTFSHRFGVAARIAMAAYFNTVGRNKVGFTVVDRDGAGQPVYVRDLRGGLERNMMRYYFGILAYLDSLSAPAGQQADRRVRTWLAFTQRYPLQLGEDIGYFERKSPEVRQQANE
jgi:hypothetical protein